MEQWKPIQGYEGRYEVSTYGNVRSFLKGSEPIVMKLISHYHGYKMIFLYGNGSSNKKHFIHRLVAQTFVENPDNKPFVNHIDCNKGNNKLENLEWMTEKENTHYYFSQKQKEDAEKIPF